MPWSGFSKTPTHRRSLPGTLAAAPALASAAREARMARHAPARAASIAVARRRRWWGSGTRICLGAAQVRSRLRF